jgi:hypothetical protein
VSFGGYRSSLTKVVLRTSMLSAMNWSNLFFESARSRRLGQKPQILTYVAVRLILSGSGVSSRSSMRCHNSNSSTIFDKVWIFDIITHPHRFSGMYLTVVPNWGCSQHFVRDGTLHCITHSCFDTVVGDHFVSSIALDFPSIPIKHVSIRYLALSLEDPWGYQSFMANF